MIPKLSDEQRQAIQNSHGGPVEVEDDLNSRVYVLIAREEIQRLIDKQLRTELQIGLDQADAGDVGGWCIDEMLDAAHGRHTHRNSPT